MSLTLAVILLIFGFALVIKSADFLVDGASALAKRLKISDLVIGLTIVSFGTSAPELIVNVIASFQGNADIAIGNILGSNIANIFLILGVAAIIYPLAVTKGTTWKEIPFSLLAVIMIGIMANDRFFDLASHNAITRTDGLTLLGFFIIFMYYIFAISKVQGANTKQADTKSLSVAMSLFLVFLGVVGLTLGGKLIVDNAISLAGSIGVSEALIGLTIVAIGTSLPELATSAVAAYKKNVDIAVGNIVGSNIFNIFWILGISSVIKPLPFSSAVNFDLLVVIFASLLLFTFMFIGKKKVLERWQGIMFILLYVFYIIYLIYRG